MARVEEWPGVHSAHALLTGDPVEGIWVDRTLARNLRLRKKTPEPGQVDIRQTVVLSPLPCWKHLTPEAYRARVAEMLELVQLTTPEQSYAQLEELTGRSFAHWSVREP